MAFGARFLPGQRATLSFAYGTLRMPYWQFLGFDALAAAVEVPLVIYGVRALGWRWEAWQGPLDHIDVGLPLALLVLALVWWRRVRPPVRALAGVATRALSGVKPGWPPGPTAGAAQGFVENLRLLVLHPMAGLGDQHQLAHAAILQHGPQ